VVQCYIVTSLFSSEAGHWIWAVLHHDIKLSPCYGSMNVPHLGCPIPCHKQNNLGGFILRHSLSKYVTA
jgi:hypothetical protein